MKLTWFGGTTIRIHIGGAILVVDAEGAPDGIDAAELVSGADVVIERFGAALPEVDAARWKPRKVPRLLDEGDAPPAVEAWSAGAGAVLVGAVGEPPLLLLQKYDVPELAAWAEKAVIVLFGGELRERTENMRDATTPRLVALAGTETDVDETFEALEGRDHGMGIVALEAGMALEI
ncbi:hypothetical protein [Devosia sp. Root635]|uniref:hypothetical protein n=1 Tax=Devosia sp. Root635 TaxID=1736575 RepID=UPI0006FB264E|nr:hypothetical protein [Devosia sp. Root635]KRA48339.1 hypothetical protein ASD80_17525 [Devosia sp. Root635]